MLNRPQITRYVAIRQRSVYKQITGVYEYTPSRGWKWLQKTLFYILKRVGAHYQERQTIYERNSIDNDNLLKTLIGQEGEWLTYIHNAKSPPRIYVGPEQEMKLWELLHHTGITPVRLDSQIEIRDRCVLKWHNIPIYVVPWMEGAILVPSE